MHLHFDFKKKKIQRFSGPRLKKKNIEAIIKELKCKEKYESEHIDGESIYSVAAFERRNEKIKTIKYQPALRITCMYNSCNCGSQCIFVLCTTKGDWEKRKIYFYNIHGNMQFIDTEDIKKKFEVHIFPELSDYICPFLKNNVFVDDSFDINWLCILDINSSNYILEKKCSIQFGWILPHEDGVYKQTQFFCKESLKKLLQFYKPRLIDYKNDETIYTQFE